MERTKTNVKNRVENNSNENITRRLKNILNSEENTNRFQTQNNRSIIKDKEKFALSKTWPLTSHVNKVPAAVNKNLPKKELLPNEGLDQSIQEVINDLSGKEKLPGAHSFEELENILDITE